MPSIGTPARLRVQPQPEPLGQIVSIGAHSPSRRLARRPGESISSAGPVHPHLAAAGAQRRAGVVAAPLAVPEHPERLAERADLGPRGAEHQLLAEDADVAPALAGLAVAAQRHRAGGQGQVGPVGPRPAPRDLSRVHRLTVLADRSASLGSWTS